MLSEYDVFLRKHEEEMIKWDNSFDPTLNIRPRGEQVKNNLIDRYAFPNNSVYSEIQ